MEAAEIRSETHSRGDGLSVWYEALSVAEEEKGKGPVTGRVGDASVPHPHYVLFCMLINDVAAEEER